MTTPLTGYTDQFPSDVLLDSGVLYIEDSVFGTMSGGLKFDPGITYRNVDFDGKRAPIKGLDRVTTRMAKITGTLIELPISALPQIEPGVSYAAGAGWSAGDQYVPRKADALLEEGQYLTNVRAVWLRGNGEFVQVRFFAALLTKYDATSQDANEVAIAVEIEARLDMERAGATTGTAPYVIEYITNPA